MRRMTSLPHLLACICLPLIYNLSWGQQENYVQAIPGTGETIELVWIPPGTSLLGEGIHQVEAQFSGFWMSEHEITHDQYQPFSDRSYDADSSFLDDKYSADAITRPSPPYLDFTNGMGRKGGYPAVSMTQQAALRYCRWLYEKTGIFYRLPTEAEWEYACRGRNGVNNAADLEDVAWYWDNSEERYHKTGLKAPNGYGLYDMLGNVAEYTADQYSDAWPQNVNTRDPHQLSAAPLGKYRRTVRGGAYDDEGEACSCTYRIPSNPAWQARDPQIPKSIWWNPDSPFVGFRIVRPPGDYNEEEIIQYFEQVIQDN